MDDKRIRLVLNMLTRGKINEETAAGLIGKENLVKAVQDRSLVTEDRNIDTEEEDEMAAENNWNARDAMNRGVTSVPSATKKPALDSGIDVTGVDWKGSSERNEARDALGDWASQQEIDDLLGSVYKQRQERAKAARAVTESLQYTGRRTLK